MNKVNLRYMECGNTAYSELPSTYFICDKLPEGIGAWSSSVETVPSNAQDMVDIVKEVGDVGVVLGGSEWMDIGDEVLIPIIMKIASEDLNFVMQTTYTEEETYYKLGLGLSKMYDVSDELYLHVQNESDRGIYEFIGKMCMSELFKNGYTLCVDMMRNPKIILVREV